MTMTLKEIKAQSTVVHKHKIRDVELSIVQVRSRSRRAQYLSLIIHDTGSERFVVLKLSTFRKIARWVLKKDLLQSRHLTTWEKIKMDLRDIVKRKACH